MDIHEHFPSQELTVEPLDTIEQKRDSIRKELEKSGYTDSLEFLNQVESVCRYRGYKLYDKVKRMPNDQERGRQSDLDHILLGVEIISRLEPILDSHFKRCDITINWDELCMGWIVHDIGEMGLSIDNSTVNRSDFLEADEEKTEAAKALAMLKHIQKRLARKGSSTELVEKATQLYEGFENRMNFETKNNNRQKPSKLSDINLVGLLIRLVDKLDCPIVMREQNIFKKRVEAVDSLGRKKDQEAINQDEIKKFNFGKLINPLLGIGAVLDDEGRTALRALVMQEAQKSLDAGDITKNTLTDIRRKTAKVLRNSVNALSPEKIGAIKKEYSQKNQ